MKFVGMMSMTLHIRGNLFPLFVLFVMMGERCCGMCHMLDNFFPHLF